MRPGDVYIFYDSAMLHELSLPDVLPSGVGAVLKATGRWTWHRYRTLKEAMKQESTS